MSTLLSPHIAQPSVKGTELTPSFLWQNKPKGYHECAQNQGNLSETLRMPTCLRLFSPLCCPRRPQSKSEHSHQSFAFIRGRTTRIKCHHPGRKSVRWGWGVSVQVCRWTECSVAHTCWLKSILRTKSALSFLETTAWFGTMPRWQFWASVTGFLVSSRHSSSKSFCFRSLAQSSWFFPGEREAKTMDYFHQGAPPWGDVTNHQRPGSPRHRETK